MTRAPQALSLLLYINVCRSNQVKCISYSNNLQKVSTFIDSLRMIAVAELVPQYKKDGNTAYILKYILSSARSTVLAVKGKKPL